MKTLVRAATVAIVWAISIPHVSAKDLEAKVISQAESLSGRALQKNVGELRTTQTAMRRGAGALLDRLHKQGLMQKQSVDTLLGAEWADKVDATQSRRTLRRLFRDDVTGQPALRFQDMEYYRGRSLAFDDSGLVRRASAIADEVALSEQILGPDEDLRAEETFVLKQRTQGQMARLQWIARCQRPYSFGAMSVGRQCSGWTVSFRSNSMPQTALSWRSAFRRFASKCFAP